MSERIEIDFHGRRLVVETGKVARQAGGAAWVEYGETVVLVTATASRSAREGIDFFPLTCDYQEKTFSAGKIPGGFFKREGRPAEHEILTSRLIDRPIRPLFPKGFRNEVQVICLTISADGENDPDVLAMNGASAALCLSGIPFEGPLGAVRVGLVEGKLVANPTIAQQRVSTIDLVIAGTADAVLMVEAGAKEVSEEAMLEAIAFGHAECRRLAGLQKDLVQKAGKPRWPFDPEAGRDRALEARVTSLVGDRLGSALGIAEKQARAEALQKLFEEVMQALGDESKRPAAREAFETLEAAEVRRMIVDRGVRVDGRKVSE